MSYIFSDDINPEDLKNSEANRLQEIADSVEARKARRLQREADSITALQPTGMLHPDSEPDERGFYWKDGIEYSTIKNVIAYQSEGILLNEKRK
jgi:hypothetical protein